MNVFGAPSVTSRLTREPSGHGSIERLALGRYGGGEELVHQAQDLRLGQDADVVGVETDDLDGVVLRSRGELADHADGAVVRGRDGYSAIEAVDASGIRPTVVPQGSGTWLGTTLKFTINEARTARPGNAAMLGRLTELMFVEILREYMQRLPAEQGGWLAGLNDPHVGKALRLLHANPGRDWSVDDLAREVAVSRSVLAQRFTELVGEAPMRYLAGWRMQLAKQMMRDGARNIQDVATRVGYESEAAFNRAFKRATGSPPAAWRKGAVLQR